MEIRECGGVQVTELGAGDRPRFEGSVGVGEMGTGDTVPETGGVGGEVVSVERRAYSYVAATGGSRERSFPGKVGSKGRWVERSGPHYVDGTLDDCYWRTEVVVPEVPTLKS